ncbi:DUF3455 domain-containing protein [Novosphingobium sp.]|uniref:DUF3455 domain-containing protein n=1 Tax=Novosphingobium sp. TaxID=1874826 RepID=UPI003B529157
MSVLILFSLLGASPPAFDIANRTVAATFHAEGVQIYECKPGTNGLAWTFREPVAALFEDGKTVGRHFAGPRWELDDGSLIKGKIAQTAPGATPADVSWLKLDVAQNANTGRLASVTAVYRINTRGGALQGPCSMPGQLQSAPYTADYVFVR